MPRYCSFKGFSSKLATRTEGAGKKESKYLGGLERRRGEELGDLGRELPVQIARADANTTHAVGWGANRSFSRRVRQPLAAAAAFAGRAAGGLGVSAQACGNRRRLKHVFAT